MSEIYLVTGAAGFIGYFLSERLLNEGKKVIGIDNLNDYYDVELKRERLSLLLNKNGFTFYQYDITDKKKLKEVFELNKITHVINLAAQAGVRYSIENPEAYIKSNILGFYNILELCRDFPVDHLIYASSSSVYGSNKKVPFEENDFVDKPLSLYAATKKSNELMAYSYSHLYDIPTTGLRFFTVYGPMGRPDMAYFKFIDKYFRNESLKIFNNGDFENDLYRDFTFIDDIVEGIINVLSKSPLNLLPKANILNIGNSQPVKLMKFIEILENSLSSSLNKKVIFKKVFEPIQLGDVNKTFASTLKLEKLIDFKPKTPLDEGLKKFTDWYVKYYKKM